jgi:DNA-binding IscR family transcriptional regulator
MPAFPRRTVGRNIHKVLDQRLIDAQKAMEEKLRSTTLADIVEDTRQAVDNESNEEKE